MKQDLIAQINQAEQQADSTNANKRVIPPLQNWKPKFCGDMNLKICANGEWWHEGSKMTRQSLVDLFPKVLWCEIDENNNAHYFLKTPMEKIGIQVEDAPLHIVAVNQIQHYNQTFIKFCTANGDEFYLDKQHEIRFGLSFNNAKISADMLEKQAEQPYILVRQNGESVLYGLIVRSIFYHLVAMGELIEKNDNVYLQLISGDETFELAM